MAWRHITGGSAEPVKGMLSECFVYDSRNLSFQVFLFAHIPPGKFERFYQYFNEENQYGFPWLKSHYNVKFLNILKTYSDCIHLQLYGHHHTDTFKLIKDGNDLKGVGLLAPAVTPWRSTLAPETGANNPGLRLFKYDMETGEVLRVSLVIFQQKSDILYCISDCGLWSILGEFICCQHRRHCQLATRIQFQKLLQCPWLEGKFFSKCCRANDEQWVIFCQILSDQLCAKVGLWRQQSNLLWHRLQKLPHLCNHKTRLRGIWRLYQSQLHFKHYLFYNDFAFRTD